MKKFYVILALALFAFNAQAFDLTEAANKMADGINNTAEAIEEKKAEREAQEAAAAQAKAEREAAAAQAKAEREAKQAEQKKALEDAKNSLKNLKNAF